MVRKEKKSSVDSLVNEREKERGRDDWGEWGEREKCQQEKRKGRGGGGEREREKTSH